MIQKTASRAPGIFRCRLIRFRRLLRGVWLIRPKWCRQASLGAKAQRLQHRRRHQPLHRLTGPCCVRNGPYPKPHAINA